MTPTLFADFCRALGIRLTRAQRVLTAVCFDGIHPASFHGADRAVARELFGAVDEVPANLRTVLLWLKGARIGGTWLASLRCLHLALTVDLSSLAPGETAFVLLVGPDTRLPQQALRYIVGALRSHPALSSLVVSESVELLTIRREDGREVMFEVLPATRGGSAVRGRSIIAALMTECAFMRNRDFAINDDEVYRAILPRVLAGGQLILETTPWSESGLVWELFQANHGSPTTCVAAHCPTLIMRGDDPRVRELVERERLRDPDNARREFDALFLSRLAGVFFDKIARESAVDDERPLVICRPRVRRAMAVDLGFSRNSSTAAVVHELETQPGQYVLGEIIELKPQAGAPLKPSEVCDMFVQVARRHGITSLCCDIHYVETLREHTLRHRIGLFFLPQGAVGKEEMFIATRNVLHEGRLNLPNHSRLIEQLGEVMVKPRPGGGLQITQPQKRDGSHGDLVSALVGAVWALEHARMHPVDRRDYSAAIQALQGGAF